jgi:hypothetical protein
MTPVNHSRAKGCLHICIPTTNCWLAMYPNLVLKPRPAYARTSKGNSFGIPMAIAMIIPMQCILHWSSTGTPHGNSHGSSNLNFHGDSHGNAHIGTAMGIPMKVSMGIPMGITAHSPHAQQPHPIPATMTPAIPILNHYVHRHINLLFA